MRLITPSQPMQRADIDDGIQFADIIRVQENTGGCDLSQEHLEPPATVSIWDPAWDLAYGSPFKQK